MNDIKWSYENQDLVVVEDTDNMIQAILNRLNTNTDELDYLYDQVKDYNYEEIYRNAFCPSTLCSICAGELRL